MDIYVNENQSIKDGVFMCSCVHQDLDSPNLNIFIFTDKDYDMLLKVPEHFYSSHQNRKFSKPTFVKVQTLHKIDPDMFLY